jgi:hypothetical protein
VQHWKLEGKFLIVEKQVLEPPISESGQTLQTEGLVEEPKNNGRKVSVEFTVDPWKFSYSREIEG